MREPTLWEWMDITREALVASKKSIGEWKAVLRAFCDEHDMKPPRVIRGYDMTRRLLEADRDGMLQKAYEAQRPSDKHIEPEQLSDEQAKELLDTLRRLRGYLVTHPDYQRGMLDAEMAMDQADAAIKSLPQPAQEERP